jgi:hypothetical protein
MLDGYLSLLITLGTNYFKTLVIFMKKLAKTIILEGYLIHVYFKMTIISKEQFFDT